MRRIAPTGTLASAPQQLFRVRCIATKTTTTAAGGGRDTKPFRTDTQPRNATAAMGLRESVHRSRTAASQRGDPSAVAATTSAGKGILDLIASRKMASTPRATPQPRATAVAKPAADAATAAPGQETACASRSEQQQRQSSTPIVSVVPMALARKLLTTVRKKRLDLKAAHERRRQVVNDSNTQQQQRPESNGNGLIESLSHLPAMDYFPELRAMLLRRPSDGNSPATCLPPLLVEGSTGCGKSVLVPLVVVDNHWRDMERRLLCTFPDLVQRGDPASTEEATEGENEAAPLPFPSDSMEAFTAAFGAASRIRVVVTQPTRAACVNMATFTQQLLQGSSPSSAAAAARIGYAVGNEVRVLKGAEIVFTTPQYLINLLQKKLATPQQRQEDNGTQCTRRATNNNQDELQPAAVAASATSLTHEMILHEEAPSCIILDEVHRRDLYTDFMLLWCKVYGGYHSASSGAHSHQAGDGELGVRPPAAQRLRHIIVMSATLDRDTLLPYLSITPQRMLSLSGAACEEVAVCSNQSMSTTAVLRNGFEVKVHFADDMVQAAMKHWAPRVSPESHRRQHHLHHSHADSTRVAPQSSHWAECYRAVVGSSLFEAMIVQPLKRLARRNSHIAAGTSTQTPATEQLVTELSLTAAKCIASLAVALVLNPPAPTESSPTESSGEDGKTRVEAFSGDVDEEDRVLVFVAGLSEMLLLASALEMVASSSRVTQQQHAAPSQRYVTVERTSDSVSASFFMGQAEAPAVSSPTAADHMALRFGDAVVSVTMLHSTSIGETSAALSALPRGANVHRDIPALFGFHQMSFKYRNDGSVSNGTLRLVKDLLDALASNPSRLRRCRLLLTTNVAESSVTIPGVRAVIDMCTERVIRWDPDTGSTVVDTSVVTHSSLLQRRGRAGRTDHGTVLHLIPKAAVTSLRRHEIPEVQRGSSATAILALSSLFVSASTVPGGFKGGNLWQWLQKLPSPPTMLAALLGAELLLQHRCLMTDSTSSFLKRDELYHFPRPSQQQQVPPHLKEADMVLHAGVLTSRGSFLAIFPMEPRLSLLVYYGGVFGVLVRSLVLAAVLSVPNVFHTSAKGGLPGAPAVRSFHNVESEDYPGAWLGSSVTSWHSLMSEFRKLIAQQHNTMSEPLLWLDMCLQRYQASTPFAVTVIEARYSANRTSLTAVDHAVVAGSHRLIQLFDASSPSSSVAEHSFRLPKEWASISRSQDIRGSLTRLRAAALDRLAHRNGRNALTTWDASSSGISDESVVNERLLTTFVAAFGGQNYLRAEEAILPAFLHAKLESNSSALYESLPDESVVGDEHRHRSTITDGAYDNACVLQCRWNGGRHAVRDVSSVMAKLLQVDRWPGDIRPIVVESFQRMQSKLCLAFSARKSPAAVPDDSLSPSSKQNHRGDASASVSPQEKSRHKAASCVRLAHLGVSVLTAAMASSLSVASSGASAGGSIAAPVEALADNTSPSSEPLIAGEETVDVPAPQLRREPDAAVKFPRIITTPAALLKDLGFHTLLPVHERPRSHAHVAAGDGTPTSASPPSAAAAATVVSVQGPIAVPWQINWVVSVSSSSADANAVERRSHEHSGTWRCPLCQWNGNSKAAWESHVRSTFHAKALQRYVDITGGLVTLPQLCAAFGCSAVPFAPVVSATSSASSSLVPCRISPFSPLNALQVRADDTKWSTAHASPSAVHRAAAVSAVLGIAANILCRRRQGDIGGDSDSDEQQQQEEHDAPNGTAAATTTKSHTSTSEWSAHGLWVVDMQQHSLGLVKGLVVAASSRTALSILTNEDHSIVVAVMVDRYCMIPLAAEPLNAAVLARLEALHLTGSEHRASRFLKYAQDSAHDGDAELKGHQPAAASASASAAAKNLHWCSVSTVCPMCTYLHTLPPPVDGGTKDGEPDPADARGAHEGSLSTSQCHGRTSVRGSVSSDALVAQMILLVLNQYHALHKHRVRLGEFQMDLLEVLLQCVTSGRIARVSTSSETRKVAAKQHHHHSPSPQVVAVEALRLFLTRRDETLVDVLESLGCLLHATVDDSHTNSYTSGSSMVRFYVPPVLPHVFPVPKLRNVLLQLHRDRLGRSRCCRHVRVRPVSLAGTANAVPAALDEDNVDTEF